MNEHDEIFTGQLDREDLRGMTHDQINAAREAGKLETMISNPRWVRPGKLEQRMAVAEAEAQRDVLEKARLALRLQADPETVIREIIDGTSEAKQLTRDDLANMTHEQINAAREAGHLNTILGIR
ncbi:hypothetical protein ACQPYK_09400 [Streptosporangium sp. CA-135522]|uniref:hypothetical protein n=1 Tax=Streptosporangium sp. CA-135522 TaxID=3240072 RepID=UPI003D8BE9D3